MSEKVRMDQYLFRARLFKSRSQATAACKEGRVQIGKTTVKSSSEVSEGDIIRIRERGLYKEIRVLVMPGKNMPKKEAKETWEDVTPEDIKQQREQIDMANRVRGPRREGARPTKKERRDMDKWRKKY